jgi:riboflavin synthase
VGDAVNLERAMAAGARMGGHVVQGHVDGTGTLIDRTPSEHGAGLDWEVLRFAVPAALVRYLVPKGSITVDGVSLTVVDVVDEPDPWFSVSLIPTTLADTTLGTTRPGDRVNLEVDILAKYVERLMAAREKEVER